MAFKLTSQTLHVPDSLRSQDRVSVKLRDGGGLVVLANGDGGLSSGEQTAQAVLDYFTLSPSIEEDDLPFHLEQLDTLISKNPWAGESTIIVLTINADKIYGVSLGNSQAWFQGKDGALTDLTTSQWSKPLFGTGQSYAHPFSLDLRPGTLLVASDGLFKLADPKRLCERLIQGPGPELALDLANLTRLPSGEWQDEVSLALVMVVEE